jgi:hypothetical protein
MNFIRLNNNVLSTRFLIRNLEELLAGSDIS